MTLEQLSAYTVKIELLPEELPMLLQGDGNIPLQQMLLFLIRRAEAFSGIPFCSRQVTAELLPTQQGGMIVYLTAKHPKGAANAAGGKGHMAALFTDDRTLRECCTALQPYLSEETESSLYRLAEGSLLVLRRLPRENRTVQHLLREYAIPRKISPRTLAHLEEYGYCLQKTDAIGEILRKS